MVIGIPRALLYYKYRYLWETFFDELNIKTIVSSESSKKILQDGTLYSIDESCIPSKLYIGHVKSLIGKCDYILVPRIENFGKKEDVCTKFNALYDIAKNTFPDVKLLDYNIDVTHHASEINGFINMGKVLGKSYRKSLNAYMKGKLKQKIYNDSHTISQEKLLEESDKLKILVVSHPYSTYDKLLGYPVIECIKKENGIPIYADLGHDKYKELYKNISNCLYWTYNKELIGTMEAYKEKVNGIIFLTAFPCGPDSLINELAIRKIKNIPVSNIILDELSSDTGLQTRIESFMDIIKWKGAK